MCNTLTIIIQRLLFFTENASRKHSFLLVKDDAYPNWEAYIYEIKVEQFEAWYRNSKATTEIRIKIKVRKKGCKNEEKNVRIEKKNLRNAGQNTIV